MLSLKHEEITAKVLDRPARLFSRVAMDRRIAVILAGLVFFAISPRSRADAPPAQDSSALVRQADTILSNANSSPSDRNRALDMLTIAGARGIPILAREIVKDNQFFAEGAAERLRKLGPSGAAAAVDSLKQLDDAAFNLKSAPVLLGLGRESLPTVVASMRDQPRLRNAAINDMAAFYTGKQLAPEEISLIKANIGLLIDQLSDDAAALAAHGAFPDVAPALTLLDSLGGDARPALPVLLKLLAPGDSTRLLRVCQTLASIGPDAAGAAMGAINALQSAPGITAALRGLGTRGIEAAALMVAGGQDVHRNAAIDTLLEIETDIRLAVKPASQPIAKPDDQSVFASAGAAPPDIYTPAMPPQAHAALVGALPVFISLIEDPKNAFFQNAVAVLPLMGTDARGAADAVVAQIDRGDTNVISRVLHAIDPEEADGILRSHEIASILAKRKQRLPTLMPPPAGANAAGNRAANAGGHAAHSYTAANGLWPTASAALRQELDPKYGGGLQPCESLASLPIEQQRIVADDILPLAKGPMRADFMPPPNSPFPRRTAGNRTGPHLSEPQEFQITQPIAPLGIKTVDGCAMVLGILNDLGLPGLQAMLHSFDPRMHEPAAAAIGLADAPSPQTLPVIALALDDPAPQVRVAAMNSLVELILVADAQNKPFDPQPLIDDLRKIASDAQADTAVRLRAIWTLAVIKPRSPETLQLLENSASCGDDLPIRRQACVALARIGPDALPSFFKLAAASAPAGVPSFAQTLQSLAWARGQVEAALEKSVGLRNGLPSASLSGEQWRNILQLSQAIAPESAPMQLAALTQANLQHDADLQQLAEKSLADQRVEALLPLADALLQSHGPLHPAAAEAMSLVRSGLQRHFAMNSTEFDQTIQAVSPELKAALDDPDARVRSAVIGVIGCGDDSVTGDLLKAAADSDPSVRATAARALGGRTSGIGALKGLLKDPDFSVRFAAALALDPPAAPRAPVGSPAPLRFKEVISVLQEGLRSSNPEIHQQAQAGLDRLRTVTEK